MEKGDSAGLKLGQIFQSETWKRELILSSSFFGGEGGGWLGAKRPSDTRDHHDTALVCLVRLHLRMQTNLLSFANESVCITMPVFSLQIISHLKRDTIN